MAMTDTNRHEYRVSIKATLLNAHSLERAHGVTLTPGNILYVDLSSYSNGLPPTKSAIKLYKNLAKEMGGVLEYRVLTTTTSDWEVQ